MGTVPDIQRRLGLLDRLGDVENPTVRRVECWRPVAGHPRYLVSDRGNVMRVGGRVLKPQRTSRGYLKVALGRSNQVYVHALVCETFHGPRPPGHHVDHIDFDRTNNAAENLRWLHALVNSVRWAGRETTATGARRNIWATPDDIPEDADMTPMTEQDWAQVEAMGW